MPLVIVNDIGYTYPVLDFNKSDFETIKHYANLGWTLMPSYERPQTMSELSNVTIVNNGAENALKFLPRIYNLYKKGYKINIGTVNDFEYLDNPFNERLLRLNDFDIEQTKLAMIKETQMRELDNFENMIIQRKSFKINPAVLPSIVATSSLIPLGIIA